jgi:succinoglycan biosynthesis protein ExoL
MLLVRLRTPHSGWPALVNPGLFKADPVDKRCAIAKAKSQLGSSIALLFERWVGRFSISRHWFNQEAYWGPTSRHAETRRNSRWDHSPWKPPGFVGASCACSSLRLSSLLQSPRHDPGQPLRGKSRLGKDLMKLVYFAPDLADPAVHRRLRMLRRGFSDVVLFGFRRSAQPIPAIEGITSIELGRAEANQLIRRVSSVITTIVFIDQHRSTIAGATVVLGRNLDMLALAAVARRRHSPSASLVFECLDIHWTMISRSPIGLAVRRLEGVLLRFSDLLVVSSPDFLTKYFNPVHGRLPRVHVVENKVLESEIVPYAGPKQPLPPGPPWRIGWFSSIRCEASLHLLARLVQRLPGRVEVVLRGGVVRQAVPDFLEVVQSTPGMEYHGLYDRRTDLADMYSDVHFTWAIDFFGNHGNSEMLLPNRLYEGSLYGAVPIAEKSVATGRWLARHGAGILLDDPIEESAADFFDTLDARTFAQAKDALALVPRSAFVCSDEECGRICAMFAKVSARSDCSAVR